jgi:RimJ/RimL family protein N-acetyltransferase
MTSWAGAVVLTTPRLRLRTYRRSDLPRFAALNADPEVMKTLGGVALTRQHSDEIAAWAQQCFATEGVGLLAVERREDAAFLGMCGLHHQQAYPDDLEIAWRLAYEHWGRGYATEAARAWLDHGFEHVGMPRVISITDRPNLRSLAVMRRLGMTFDHEAVVEDDGVTHDAVVHVLTAEQWESSRRVRSGYRSRDDHRTGVSCGAGQSFT